MNEDVRERLAEAVLAHQRKKSFFWVVFVAIGVGIMFRPWPQADEGLYFTVLIGFLFLFGASFLRSLHHLKLKLEELGESIDAANRAIYGKNWKAERDAVSLLIGLLNNPKEDLQKKSLENLKKLTGKDFGLDQDKWLAWWNENRATFRRAQKE